MKAMMAVKDLINASNIQGFTILKTFLKKYPFTGYVFIVSRDYML